MMQTTSPTTSQSQHRLHRVLRPLLILLALVFLFEAWLWDHLAPIVHWIVARIPLRVVKEKLAVFIERLPPAATLVVFVIPILVLLPFKILGVWLLAHGHWLAALGVLAMVKVVSLGVTAFIFDLTRPKLLQMDWFRRFYEWVMRGIAWAHVLVDPIKRRLKSLFRVFSPRRASRTVKLLRRIRHRMQARAAT
jgi:hypothetical protein